METTSFMIMILMLGLAASLCFANPTFSNQTDQNALFSIKASIIDPLGVLSSWNDSVSLCQWTGVKCGRRHQRVVELNLSSQSLTGFISPFIANLSFLRSIYLQDNQFQGNIPQEISHLSHLKDLNFSINALQGEIPSNLSLCLNLRTIWLKKNNLVGKIPAAFGSLFKLSFLSIRSNSLHGIIPPSLGNLSLLQRLDLGENNLEGTIPETIGRLKILEYFGIAANSISGRVPPSLYNISNLKVISIVDNQLKGSLPPDIGFTLPSLVDFAAGVNQFTGHIPASFSNASRLIHLDISNNGLFGPIPVDLGRRMNDLQLLNLEFNNLGNGAADDLDFIDSLTNCTQLQKLSLARNRLGGVLPNSITNLSTVLSGLYLGGNHFVGNIPAGISNFVNLIMLGLSQNLLSGKIPFSVGKLQNLQGLDLSSNQLSGSVPETIGNLSQLFQLDLSGNNLTGWILQSLENVKGFQILNLSYNSFAGSIPKRIGLFSSLVAIDLSNNYFNGSLPLELGTLNNLEELYISYNNLSGEIPQTLGSCSKLEFLNMSHNSFHGNIPSLLASLKGLVHLDISHNNLTGTIPTDLEKLHFLELLNLSYNNFKGEMPLKGAFSNTSIISIVGNMNLCGGVPELHLPPCITLKHKEHNHRLSSKVIIIIVTVSTLCLVIFMSVVAIYLKRRPKKALPKTPFGEELFRMISYSQLLKATDGFSLYNLLGAGSFGSVYKGILQQIEKPIAVKVFNLEVLEASKSFITECEVLRKTRHRNLLKIITVCSSITFEGRDFKALVFEFMQNGSLESWLHPGEDTSKKLNLAQRLNIAIDVVSALEYLHHHCETPIIHCDLKPSNVLLDNGMIAHVGDFGLARFLAVSNSTQRQTNSITIKGSIGYVPPEYGMGEAISTNGDIYSYGILLLEMLTGKRPTNEMFKDDMNLHSLCKMAVPDKVMKIVDRHLLMIDGEISDQTTNMRQCLISLLRIGVACSTEIPNARMSASEIVKELNAIKQNLIGMSTHG